MKIIRLATKRKIAPYFILSPTYCVTVGVACIYLAHRNMPTHYEALRYKPEGCGFDSRQDYWEFSLTKFFRPHYGPGFDTASNRNEYQEYLLRGKGGRCVGLKLFLTSCANFLEILGASAYWSAKVLCRPVQK